MIFKQAVKDAKRIRNNSKRVQRRLLESDLFDDDMYEMDYDLDEMDDDFYESDMYEMDYDLDEMDDDFYESDMYEMDDDLDEMDYDLDEMDDDFYESDMYEMDYDLDEMDDDFYESDMYEMDYDLDEMDDDFYDDLDEEDDMYENGFYRLGERVNKRKHKRNGMEHSSNRLIRENAELKQTLQEMSTHNAKLLYTVKLIQERKLTSSEQKRIVEAFDNARNVNEVKRVYNTLKGKRSTGTNLHESASNAIKFKNVYKDGLVEAQRSRIQRLAGL